MTPSELIEETDFLRKWNRLSAQVHVDDYADTVQSLATQLDDAKQAIVTFRATMEQMRRERDEARAHAEERTAKARVFAKSAAMESDSANEHAATIEATWEALGTIGRGRGVTLPERAAKVVAVRDAMHAKLAMVRQAVTADDYDDVRAEVLRIIDEKEGGM